MATPRFYLSSLTTRRAVLTGPEAAHAFGSRRLRVGDGVVLFDGRGREATGRILVADRRRVEIELLQAQQRPDDAPVRLTVAVAMPKGPRQDDLVEKCTELGVCAVWPMVTEHMAATVSTQRLRRWRKIALEAAKQSQRAWLPDIQPPQVFDHVISRAGGFDLAVLADPASENPPLLALLAERRPVSELLLLVGPEGGFTEREISTASAAGIRPVSVGRTLLRVETAAVAASAVIVAHAAARAR